MRQLASSTILIGYGQRKSVANTVAQHQHRYGSRVFFSQRGH